MEIGGTLQEIELKKSKIRVIYLLKLIKYIM